MQDKKFLKQNKRLHYSLSYIINNSFSYFIFFLSNLTFVFNAENSRFVECLSRKKRALEKVVCNYNFEENNGLEQAIIM